MKRFAQSVAFGLLAMGVAVGITSIVCGPWSAAPLFFLATSGCVIGMCELFGYDVG